MAPGRSRLQVTAGLVVANLVPLVGVVAFGWNLHSLLVLYWLESGVVGIESVAKILRAEGEDDPEELSSMRFEGRSGEFVVVPELQEALAGVGMIHSEQFVESFRWESNRSIARFFVSHYGIFWLVHGVVLLAVLALDGIAPAAPRPVAVGTLGLVSYHVVSYMLNYVDAGEYEHTGPVTQMVEPYRRVLVMHVTIVFGGLLIALLGAPVSLLAVMVLLKLLLDLRGHWKEHDRARRREPTPTSGGEIPSESP